MVQTPRVRVLPIAAPRHPRLPLARDEGPEGRTIAAHDGHYESRAAVALEQVPKFFLPVVSGASAGVGRPPHPDVCVPTRLTPSRARASELSRRDSAHCAGLHHYPLRKVPLSSSDDERKTAQSMPSKSKSRWAVPLKGTNGSVDEATPTSAAPWGSWRTIWSVISRSRRRNSVG